MVLQSMVRITGKRFSGKSTIAEKWILEKLRSNSDMKLVSLSLGDTFDTLALSDNVVLHIPDEFWLDQRNVMEVIVKSILDVAQTTPTLYACIEQQTSDTRASMKCM